MVLYGTKHIRGSLVIMLDLDGSLETMSMIESNLSTFGHHELKIHPFTMMSCGGCNVGRHLGEFGGAMSMNGMWVAIMLLVAVSYTHLRAHET